MLRHVENEFRFTQQRLSAIISVMESKLHDIRSLALHTCNMHVGVYRNSMNFGLEFSGRSGIFASKIKSAIPLPYSD